jgi:hypothetical protein
MKLLELVKKTTHDFNFVRWIRDTCFLTVRGADAFLGARQPQVHQPEAAMSPECRRDHTG